MKKRLTALLTIIVLSGIFFSTTALAANTSVNTVKYYDENGNQITVNGLYYNSDNYPMYNAGCYYTDADGNLVYVGGCRVYYYDAEGNLTVGKYYYDANGKAVSRPAAYPDGLGCGTYCYNAQGSAVNGTYYYDDFGNPVELPENTVPSYSSCCRRGCGSNGRYR